MKRAIRLLARCYPKRWRALADVLTGAIKMQLTHLEFHPNHHFRCTRRSGGRLGLLLDGAGGLVGGAFLGALLATESAAKNTAPSGRGSHAGIQAHPRIFVLAAPRTETAVAVQHPSAL